MDPRLFIVIVAVVYLGALLGIPGIAGWALTPLLWS